MRIVCISDTHNRHGKIAVPEGDLLLHAGDFTNRGLVGEIEAFAEWFHALPHPRKVVIAGNHDFLFERDPQRARELLGDVDYLDTEGVRIDGIHIWGSPWQPWFHDWAFNLERGPALAAHWAKVPDDVDVLLTHSPAMGCLDRTIRGEEVGCADLAAALARIAPRLHVFGHIHEAVGIQRRPDGILAVNASSCDLRYRPVNPPVVIDWQDGQPEVADRET